MEDVNSLTKEEFLKFLNCSHHSTKSERIVLAGPKNRTISVLKQFGKFTACDVQLPEFSLNHQILRIPLPKVDLENLSARQVAQKFRTQKTEKKRKKNNVVVSRFGRKLKKKQFNIHSLVGSKARSSLDINKPTLAPKVYQKIKKPQIVQRFKPSDIVIKSTTEKTLPETMATWTYKQVEKPQEPKPAKPQFIIKYVPTEPTYFLKMTPLKHPEDGKLKYSFETLVKDIKNMKLPSPTWKIKVVVKSNKIASIIFTNKCVLERTVSFNAKSEFFEIVIENRPAILLGSPNAVTCVEDIEILLNIIHTISAKNPMIYYKN